MLKFLSPKTFQRSLLASALVTGAVAQADPAAVKQALSLFPADAEIAIVVPSAAAVDTELEGLLANKDTMGGFDLESAIGDLGAELNITGAKRIKDIVAGVGGDTAKPVAIFLDVNADGVEFATAVPVTDAEKAKEAISEAAPDGEFAEVALDGLETKAQYNDAANVGYVLSEGMAIVASTKALLGAVAGASEKKTPATVAYTPVAEEIAVVLKLDALAASGAFESPELVNAQPLLAYFQSFLDEGQIALSLGQKPGYLRLAGHEKPAAAPAAAAEGEPGAAAAPAGVPGSVTLHRLYPANTIALANLRFSPTLVDFGAAVAGYAIGDPKKAKEGAQLAPMVTGQLRDELAVGALGILENKQPKLLITANVKNGQAIMNLLGLAGIQNTPRFTHQDVPVIGSDDVGGGFKVLAAAKNQVLVVSNDEETLKGALDGLVAEGTATKAPQALVDASNHGFLFIDQAKLGEAMKEAAPLLGATDLGTGQVSLSLSEKDSFRSATLSLSDGISTLLEGVLPNIIGAGLKEDAPAEAAAEPQAAE
jgi:hypothetical protein